MYSTLCQRLRRTSCDRLFKPLTEGMEALSDDMVMTSLIGRFCLTGQVCVTGAVGELRLSRKYEITTLIDMPLKSRQAHVIRIPLGSFPSRLRNLGMSELFVNLKLRASALRLHSKSPGSLSPITSTSNTFANMAKDRTLKAALGRVKGVDRKLEHQKKVRKQAEKKKRQSRESEVDVDALEAAAAGAEIAEAQSIATGAERAEEELAANAAAAVEKASGEAEGWETDEAEDEDEEMQDGGVRIGDIDDSESESDSDDEPFQNGAAEDDEDAEDIPLSDIESLASEDKGDVIPHQRLTINNTGALLRSLKSFALPANLPFSQNQTVVSAEPVEIADVEDDLNRELAFYKQSLDAVKEARAKLKKEGVPFSRPNDYFAEMVKTEEQMGKVKQKMVDEAARKKASSEARRQRDLKKFGKAVQVAKLQERDRAKRDTLDKIKDLKRKRQGGNDLDTKESDLFDVALEDAAETAKNDKADRRAAGAAGAPNRKRQKKDEKFGFGGKKRFGKSNDAKSSGDMTGFSTKRMKGKGGKAPRPGKSKRAKF